MTTHSDRTTRTLTRHWRAGLRALAVAASLVALAMVPAGCSPSYPDCDGDKTCASHNEFCVDGHCQQCREDSHCTAIDACMRCHANACLRDKACCKSDLDCPGGRCVDNRCAKAECTVNSDCAGSQRCVDGTCTAQTGCTDDSACPDGQRCQDGSCTTATCDIKPIYFDFNEYAIRLDQEPALRTNADCLKQSSYNTVRVEGHCDERGSDEYNLTLAQRRANSVARTYKALGVDRIGPTLSWGEEKPVCGGSNERCWRQNRRAETTLR